ncbi:unnamed protein product [Blepharisma stoltei]|uniref:Uncharacterized protein n=1 Tax=Blepharisma stoltei TaxID=1481888 RepID=A0AAU9J845_9CILI|nr:unnamed protein product [Blepharisma stoltei]
MNTYGGFPTKQQEILYGKLSESLILLLSHYIIQTIKHSEINQIEFTERLLLIFQQMSKLEANKYSPPRLSEFFQDLALMVAPKEEIPANEEYTSMDSPTTKTDSDIMERSYISPKFHSKETSFTNKRAGRSFSNSKLDKDIKFESPVRTYKGWAQDSRPKILSKYPGLEKTVNKYFHIKKHQEPSKFHQKVKKNSENAKDIYIRSPLS